MDLATWGAKKFRLSISVAVHRRAAWADFTDWLSANSELKISPYVVEAALLCQRLGITDPSEADLDGMLIISNGNDEQPEDTSVIMSDDTRRLFDNLFS